MTYLPSPRILILLVFAAAAARPTLCQSPIPPAIAGTLSKTASAARSVAPALIFASQQVGSSSTATVTVTILTAGTIGSISALTQGAPNLDFTSTSGGTCTLATAYAVNNTCTVQVNFIPKYPGSRKGAVVLLDSTSNQNVIGTAYLQGTGQGPQIAFRPTVNQSLFFNAFGFPYGLAIDGSGNFFVSDQNNTDIGTVYKVTSSGVKTAIASGSSWLAIDGAGNLYVVSATSVLKETPTATGAYTQTTLTGSYTAPQAVAVDGSGNVFVASGASVFQETLQSDGTYIESEISGPWTTPSGLAVDDHDNVYIADRRGSALYKATLSGSTYAAASLATDAIFISGVAVDGIGDVYYAENIDFPFDDGQGGIFTLTLQPDGSYVHSYLGFTEASPEELAIDPAGNVFAADESSRAVIELNYSSARGLYFNNTATGTTSTDSPMTVAVLNLGNTALHVSALSYPVDFPESANNSGDCTASTTLATTASCNLTVDFTPVTPLSGNTPLDLSEDATITTDSLNSVAAQASIPLGGTEIAPTAATPVITPPSGSYVVPFTVTITDSMPNTTIHYAFSEQAPSPTSPVYTGPITITGPIGGIAAIAVVPGYIDSGVTNTLYQVIAAAPVFSVPAGTYASAQTVTLADTSPGVTIYYSTDGSAPTTSSAMYSSTITVSKTETIRAIAIGAGYTNSAIASAAYTIAPPAAAPTFSIPAGAYTSAQTVALSDATVGAIIYYTTDGSTPTATSIKYMSAITISGTETIGAIAVATGYTNSAIASATYTIVPPAAAPIFSVPVGTYTSAQTVAITDTTAGAAIYYTTDGSAPTTASTKYSSAITVSATETIQAIAVATGYSTSPVASATYTINLPPASFSVTSSATSLSIAPGQSGTVTISIAPQNGFSSPTTFSCSGAPAGVTCSFLPSTVTPSGGAAASTVLTISDSASASLTPLRSGPFIPGATLAIAFTFLGWRRRRSFQLWYLFIAAVGLSACLVAGCGGSSTPKPQTTQLSVIATSGSVQQTVPISVTIE